MPSQSQSCLVIYCILPFFLKTFEDAAGQYSTFQCFKEINQGPHESYDLVFYHKEHLMIAAVPDRHSYREQ